MQEEDMFATFANSIEIAQMEDGIARHVNLTLARVAIRAQALFHIQFQCQVRYQFQLLVDYTARKDINCNGI